MSHVLPELPRLARYALAAAFAMAERPGERLTSTQLADLVDAPKAMLAKVLSSLTAAGIVDGVRGHHGGYFLARPAHDIQLVEVVAAATGSTEPRRIECVLGARRCDATNPCAMHDLWISVVDEACKVLCNRTLTDVLDHPPMLHRQASTDS